MNEYLPPSEYLPHAEPMMLLDEVVNVTENDVHCQVSVHLGGVLGPFLDAQGNLPGWFALELMAQTVGVWSGWHRRQAGLHEISLGMVLGARELTCAAGHLPGNATLNVQARLLMQDERFGSFDCTITVGEECLASGRVNTFQPTSEELTSLFNQGETA
ncbi:unnamed protein product [Klebsiella pneumoniae subsp. rhinoscleromatis SB3432]|jgi:predicted hotdog family 3-hydroxylacyl-ACP dehydratase|uniref:3-hydroxydecanoyl-ACP dehydratase n=3 Tax=Enterobacterales TaxID=91347 RepID=A0A377X6V4_KLEPN|nr:MULTISPECIES: hypothetical protein [Enterobacterales]MDI6929938.1 3-hydroxy-fatty acyl-ACP dehydratase [Serratia sp. Se-PFBMAAmG]QHI80058.1 3-hydroxy-fatty acyl-ACP dehydratase [Serratia sp. NGAS9]CCI78752.1 unnamed protein product [Klebsiella pneumoniae subsp. rhinoscleromatis SB3432]STT68539.1 3-hydroxydecanoyl-ACP dehydratase [Klebsiella pneumoniae]STV64610.1 3-hydroxydecanoyl-ACP dehydratase [Klebsiella pneumoniae subsp. rhinoscleromatis]